MGDSRINDFLWSRILAPGVHSTCLKILLHDDTFTIYTNGAKGAMDACWSCMQEVLRFESQSSRPPPSPMNIYLQPHGTIYGMEQTSLKCNSTLIPITRVIAWGQCRAPLGWGSAKRAQSAGRTLSWVYGWDIGLRIKSCDYHR